MQSAFRERLSSVSDMQEVVNQNRADDGSLFIEQSDMLLQLTKVLVRKISMGAVYFTIIENDSRSRKNRYFMHNGFSFAQADIGNEFYVSNVNPNLLVKKVNPFDYTPSIRKQENMDHLGRVKVLMVEATRTFVTFVYRDKSYKIKTPNCWEWLDIPVGNFFHIRTKLDMYHDKEIIVTRLGSGDCTKINGKKKVETKATKTDIIETSILLASSILVNTEEIDNNLDILSKYDEELVSYCFREMVRTSKLSKEEEENFTGAEIQRKLKGLRTRPADANKSNPFSLVLEK